MSNVSSQSGILIVAENRKVRHDYEIIDRFEAGIVLLGSEVKAIRQGGINYKDTYVRGINGELFLIGCSIVPYKFARVEDYNDRRDRKLLLKKREIERLIVETTRKGLTLVATKVYFKAGLCKVEIALGRGKKLYDKREDVKKREQEREMRRSGL